MKNFLLGVISTVVAVLLLFIGGELAIRAMHFYTDHFSDRMNPRLIDLDDTLGWLPATDYHFTGELADASGSPYPVEITTNSAGYRMFGDVAAGDRKKVLFIGDSYTQAMHVANDRTYYALLGEALDIEVFAFGVDGFGTLQEFLLIDSIIDDISPDIVVLQLCPNDFINNHFGLELDSAFNNNGLRRPYLINDEVTYRTPARFPALREFAAKYSAFLYFIIKKIDLLQPPPSMSAERLIQEQGMAYPMFAESVAITDQLLGKIRARIPADIPVYAFATDHGFPYLEAFRQVSANNGIQFIDGTSQAVTAAEKKGVVTRSADRAHWNNEGHRIVADVLTRYFEQSR